MRTNAKHLARLGGRAETLDAVAADGHVVLEVAGVEYEHRVDEYSGGGMFIGRAPWAPTRARVETLIEIPIDGLDPRRRVLAWLNAQMSGMGPRSQTLDLVAPSPIGGRVHVRLTDAVVVECEREQNIYRRVEVVRLTIEAGGMEVLA
jgi:hypothetical protein